MRRIPYILDIGGEGRHRLAWNLNPSPVRTGGPMRGEPIPRHVAGRADAIPLGDQSVDVILVERTPLTRAAMQEIERVLKPSGTLILRHAVAHGHDPHRTALEFFRATTFRSHTKIRQRPVMQTVLRHLRGSTSSAHR